MGLFGMAGGMLHGMESRGMGHGKGAGNEKSGKDGGDKGHDNLFAPGQLKKEHGGGFLGGLIALFTGHHETSEGKNNSTNGDQPFLKQLSPQDFFQGDPTPAPNPAPQSATTLPAQGQLLTRQGNALAGGLTALPQAQPSPALQLPPLATELGTGALPGQSLGQQLLSQRVAGTGDNTQIIDTSVLNAARAGDTAGFINALAGNINDSLNNSVGLFNQLTG